MRTLVLALACAPAIAAAAPPGQTVYRCTISGKTVYTDAPCLNAKVIDATPTQGMDTYSGTVRKGADAQRDQVREATAKALKPLTGLDREGLDRAGRRTKLPSAAQAECRSLDNQLPNTVDPEELFRLRTRYRSLGCL